VQASRPQGVAVRVQSAVCSTCARSEAAAAACSAARASAAGSLASGAVSAAGRGSGKSAECSVQYLREVGGGGSGVQRGAS
jgi:hypothetical protein